MALDELEIVLEDTRTLVKEACTVVGAIMQRNHGEQERSSDSLATFGRVSTIEVVAESNMTKFDLDVSGFRFGIAFGNEGPEDILQGGEVELNALVDLDIVDPEVVAQQALVDLGEVVVRVSLHLQHAECESEPLSSRAA